ncbi:MAG: FtsX-like permease family protein [Butyrivibrio sp.]|nr:FtsX-like permease family protein [Butyrivibrio sp.]
MNIIAKLTMRHLNENRKRTIVTILGIAMSTSLISAMMLGIFSFFKFFGYVAIQRDGDSQVVYSEVTKEQYDALKADKKVAVAGLLDANTKLSGIRLDSGVEDRYRLGNILSGNQYYYSIMINSDYEGTLPTNSSEIAVEEQFLKDNNLSLKVGDNLSFELGNRSYMENGERIYIGGNYRSEETFESLFNENCKITAILHGNRSTKGYDIIRGLDDGYYPTVKNASVYIKLKKCDHTAIKQIKQLTSDYGLAKSQMNTEYLLSSFAFEDSDGTYRSFFVMMAIALAVVVGTSVILIVNSIGMSLTERMRYLGMLASVGATGRQKRFSIYYEGLVLGVIGIPLGILLGYIGTKITLTYMGAKLLEADVLVGIEGMRGGIPIVCAPIVIVAIIICSAITIFISTIFPAIKAAKVTPIDALRQNDTIKTKARSLRTPFYIKKLFGYEGELAYKNIKRNGIKGSVITASIAVSVILFLSITFICDAIDRVNKYDFDLPCQLFVSSSLSESEKLRTELEGMEGIDDVYNAGIINFNFVRTKANEKEPLANRDIANPEFYTPEYSKLNLVGMTVVIVDDDAFRELLSANGLSEEKYFDGTLRGILLNTFFHDTKAGAVYTDKIIGQSLHYDDEEGYPPAVEVGDLIGYDKEHKVLNLISREMIGIFVPASVYYEKAAINLSPDILTVDLAVETTAHEEVYTRIYEMLERENYHNYSVSDLTDSLTIMNTITLMLKVVMYGFTGLLTLITVANIINTISTGILLRRKEFAMYKSVGMTSGGFRKMLRLETFLYGIRALIFGIPASLIISFFMYRSFDNELVAFNPSWIMYIAVVGAVFGIVGASMLLSINKIKDDSIIEALKNDAV